MISLDFNDILVMNCFWWISGREYTIGGRVGEDVVLPCDVNVTSCGRVYFITWTKNTSTEWKRVYLYSDSYETPMGQLMDPEKASFKLEKNAAYLIIKSLSVEDEGAYKCDVTYVHGKCPSLSFVQLHAFSKYRKIFCPLFILRGPRAKSPDKALRARINWIKEFPPAEGERKIEAFCRILAT